MGRACVRRRILVVDLHDRVKDAAQQDGAGVVDDGMLLDEHGGDADQHTHHGEGDLPGHRFLKPPGVPGCEHYGKRTDDVDGRIDVCVRVKLIEVCQKPRENIVAFERRRAQVLAGGVDEVDEDRHRVCKDDEPHQPLEGGNVAEQGVEQHPDQVDKPQHVRDHKVFAKGDQVIERTVHHAPGAVGGDALDKEKGKTVERPVKQQFQVGKLRCVQLGKTEFPIVDHREKWVLSFTVR